MSKRQRKQGGILVPPDVRKLGEALIDQQMWCWGCDVRHADGNLLLAYGFEKRPSPNPRFHSAYTLPLCVTCALTVWGWGLWVADARYGSVFVSRSRFTIAYTARTVLAPCAWQAHDLPLSQLGGGDQSCAYPLVAQACCAAASYESWLPDHVGADYRNSVNAAWPERRRHKGGVSADQMMTVWTQLAETLEPIGAGIQSSGMNAM